MGCLYLNDRLLIPPSPILRFLQLPYVKRIGLHMRKQRAVVINDEEIIVYQFKAFNWRIKPCASHPIETFVTLRLLSGIYLGFGASYLALAFLFPIVLVPGGIACPWSRPRPARSAISRHRPVSYNRSD
jgi:hypothetical protein